MHTFETPEPPTARGPRPAPATSTITADETAQTTVELTPLNAAGRSDRRGGHRRATWIRHRGRSSPATARPVPSVRGRSDRCPITCPRDSTLDVRHRRRHRSEPRGAYAEAVDRHRLGLDVDVETVAGSARLHERARGTSGSVGASGRGGHPDRVRRRRGRPARRRPGDQVRLREPDRTPCRDRCDPCQRRERQHHDRHRARHRRLAGRLHRHRAGSPRSSTSPRPPDQISARCEITAQTVSGNLRVHRS